MFNDSLYKSSGAELKLMTDMDKYLIVENGICKGITIANYQYAKANNLQYSDYNPSKPKSYILYNNINALYSEEMIQYMLTEILAKVDLLDIQNITLSISVRKAEVSENWLSLYNEKLVHDKEVKG
ncbi:8451_t:CDS:2, partial [Funneliformis mosseae]